jgi:hypothetical protein
MHLVLLDQTTDDLIDLHPDQRPNSRYGPLPDLEMGMSQRTTRLQSSRALDPAVGIVRAEWLLDMDLIGSNANHRTWKAWVRLEFSWYRCSILTISLVHLVDLIFKEPRTPG